MVKLNKAGVKKQLNFTLSICNNPLSDIFSLLKLKYQQNEKNFTLIVTGHFWLFYSID